MLVIKNIPENLFKSFYSFFAAQTNTFSQTLEERITDIISKMTLEEKIYSFIKKEE